MSLSIIPKIHFRDERTYIDNPVIALNSYDLYKKVENNEKKFALKYFEDKKIIISSVMSDESESSYFDHLDTFKSDSRFILMSLDCATYEDFNDEFLKEELAIWRTSNDGLKLYIENNHQGLEILGLLKGTNKHNFKKSFQFLENLFIPNGWIIYLTGNIRSNPKFFDAFYYIKENFSEINFLNREVYLYGFNKQSIKNLISLQEIFPKLHIISESYLASAIYRENPHYKIETRIKKSWEKYHKQFYYNEELDLKLGLGL